MTSEDRLRPFMTPGAVSPPSRRLDPRAYMDHTPQPVNVTWGRDQFGLPELVVDQRCSCGSHDVLKGTVDIQGNDVLKAQAEQDLVRRVEERMDGHVGTWVEKIGD